MCVSAPAPTLCSCHSQGRHHFAFPRGSQARASYNNNPNYRLGCLPCASFHQPLQKPHYPGITMRAVTTVHPEWTLHGNSKQTISTKKRRPWWLGRMTNKLGRSGHLALHCRPRLWTSGVWTTLPTFHIGACAGGTGYASSCSTCTCGNLGRRINKPARPAGPSMPSSLSTTLPTFHIGACEGKSAFRTCNAVPSCILHTCASVLPATNRPLHGCVLLACNYLTAANERHDHLRERGCMPPIQSSLRQHVVR